MPNCIYPYLPSNRSFRFVSDSDPFMQAAAIARRECSGDPLYPVGAVLVRDGNVLARAGNGFNRGSGGVHVCPRIVLDCPSGTGYDLCHLHDSPGHAEPMLMATAKEQGIDTIGADVYLYGHWWCCEPCWKSMIDGGVQDVYLLENADEVFSRDRVYGETLKSTVKSVYIAGPLTNLGGQLDDHKQFYESLGKVCESLGCRTCIPHRDNQENINPGKNHAEVFAWAVGCVKEADVTIAEVSIPSLGTGGELVVAAFEKKPIVLLSKKGTKVSRFVRGNPAVVYHIEYETVEEAGKMLENVLRQL